MIGAELDLLDVGGLEVVLAVGAWTPAVLAAAGLPAAGYRTKSIQYVVHRVGGWRPPQFVDGVTGLFGRPTADGGLLLGLPTERWDVEPDRPPLDPALPESAAELARARFPALRLGAGGRPVHSCDCYAGDPGLALRRVVDAHPLFTFTGGAGGSAKTALAASARAAVQLGRVCGPPAGREPRPTVPGPPAGAPTRRTNRRSTMTDEPTYHTIGIGAGPANLSLAALFEDVTTERIALFDRQPGPAWHNRLLHSGVRMQTSWLKDLVSLVAPRHELTFLNYLVTTGRMYALLNSQFDVIPRLEYVRCLAWAAGKLEHVHYALDGAEVGDVHEDALARLAPAAGARSAAASTW